MQSVDVNGLIKARRILQIGYAVVVIAYAASVLTVFFDVPTSIMMINATTIFYFFIMRTMDKRYNRSFVQTSLKLSGEKQLDRVQVYRKGTITGSYLKERVLLPARLQGGSACGMGFMGRKGTVQAEVCELTVCFDRVEQEAKKKVGILTGVWMELKPEKYMEKDFILVSRAVFDSGIASEHYEQEGYHEIPICNSHYNKSFRLFGLGEASERDVDRFFGVCRKLIQKESEEDSSFMIRISGSGIYVFLVERKLVFDTPLRGEITEDIVAWNRLPEFVMLMDMADISRSPGPTK